jgi:threonine efflux protein
MLSVLITIWLLDVASLIIPGANVLLVSHLSASGSPRGATAAALGVAAGAALWASAAVLGVDALFVAFPTVRLFMQIAGAAYLLYLASRLWRERVLPAGQPAATSAARAFRLGLLTNLSNPKSALFFGSVFSAAMPAHPSVPVLCSAVALVSGNSLAWHLLLAYLLSRRAVQTGYELHRGVFARVGATVMGALGLGLLMASLREARR